MGQQVEAKQHKRRRQDANRKQTWKEKTAEKEKELPAQYTGSNDFDIRQQERQNEEATMIEASITYLSLQHLRDRYANEGIPVQSRNLDGAERTFPRSKQVSGQSRPSIHPLESNQRKLLCSQVFCFPQERYN